MQEKQENNNTFVFLQTSLWTIATSWTCQRLQKIGQLWLFSQMSRGAKYVMGTQTEGCGYFCHMTLISSPDAS